MYIKLDLNLWTTIMEDFVLANDGLPIFDATRAIITHNAVGWPVNHSRNVVTIKTADGFLNYRA